MEARVWSAGLLPLVVFVGLMKPGSTVALPAATAVCARVSAADAIVLHLDSCPALDSPAVNGYPFGVVEGDEAALHRDLNLVRKNKEEYMAVLFYASWCPFSKAFRPNFDTLASMFPTIHHYAFEESVIRLSTLTRYGIRGFPTLFLLNSNMRVRYRGLRTINSVVAFYTDVTGIGPTSLDLGSLGEAVRSSSVVAPEEEIEQENCPFSWARSPEQLLQQNTYLALATTFVLLRLLYILLPKLNACVNRVWMRRVRYASLTSLLDNSQAYFELVKRGFGRLNPCKRSKGAMDAKLWASKSLASVSIGESSGRAHSGSERR